MPRQPQLDETLGHWAARLSWAARGALERRLRPHGLTPPMMAALLAMDGGCERGTDLAKVMGVDAAAVTRLLDRMAEAGFISRCELQGDKRSRKLSLSPKALGLLPKLRKASAEMEAGLAQSLSAGEKAILISQLKGLVDQAEKL
jgi:DNA-binding MarR family transcriptional regulator